MKNPKVSRTEEIIKIRAETNEKGTKETIAKIRKTKRCFFEKISTINHQPDSSRQKWEQNKINKIRNESGEITKTTQNY